MTTGGPGRAGTVGPESAAEPPRRVALLVNPVAGGKHGTSIAATAAGRLRARGVDVEIVTGRDAAEAAEQARRCVGSGTDVLAVVGGDGLVHLALQAAAGTDTALAVLPAGTGNDFARTLGIPRRDPAAAADLILDGGRRTVDLGRSSVPDDAGRPAPQWFATVLTSGFDSLVVDRANRMRRPRGRMRYNIALLAELGLLRPRAFTLEADGERHELEAVLVAVGNGASYGGGMRICPQAALDDGKFSVTVVGAANRRTLLRVFPQVYRGTHVTHPLVRTFTARRIRLHTDDMRGYADGEPVGRLPLEAETVPGALRVVVPKEAGP